MNGLKETIFHLNLYGCGRMAQAIFSGLASRPSQNFALHTYTPTYTRAHELAQLLGGKAYRKLEQLPPSPYHFLALKPQQFHELAADLAPLLARHSREAAVVSIMAGIPIREVQERLGLKEVIRVMPNTPCRVGRGISLMLCSPEVGRDKRERVADLFRGVSKVFPCSDEDQLDRLMALSACGPAYLFEMASFFEEYLQANGLSPESSRLMVGELFMGPSLLLSESSDSPSELSRQVASKGGATEMALGVLKEGDLRGLMDRAMEKAYERAKELAAQSR